MALHTKNLSKIIISSLLFILFLSGCGEKKITPLGTKKTYSFKYHDKMLVLKQKKPFMLFFLSKDCGVCTQQIKELKGLKNIIQIAVINDASSKAAAKKIKIDKNLSLPLVYDKSQVSFLSQAVGGVSGVPVIYIYQASGLQKYRFLGLTPKGLIQRSINQL